MLHSKFSLSFDTDNQMVSIYIEDKVNGEMTFIAPIFHFDDNGKLIIPPNSYLGFNKSSFSYLARHVKTKVAQFKKYIEDEYSSVIIDEDGHGYYGDEQERELEEIKRIDNESKSI